MNVSIAPSQKDIERFFAKVDRKGKNECWLWKASKDSDGYGTFRLGLVVVLAHRFSYTISFGKIDKGLHVCHTCDTPACVNPRHLFLGTNHDNMQDMVRKGRSTFGRFRGSENGNSKLKNETVLEIKKMLREGKSLMNIARQFGISKRTVMDIKQNKTWYWLS